MKITTLTAAQICGVAPDTIRLWARSGRLPAVITPAGIRLYDKTVVEQLAARRAGGRK